MDELVEEREVEGVRDVVRPTAARVQDEDECSERRASEEDQFRGAKCAKAPYSAQAEPQLAQAAGGSPSSILARQVW